jgi:hypothetical protein
MAQAEPASERRGNRLLLDDRFHMLHGSGR